MILPEGCGGEADVDQGQRHPGQQSPPPLHTGTLTEQSSSHSGLRNALIEDRMSQMALHPSGHQAV